MILRLRRLSILLIVIILAACNGTPTPQQVVVVPSATQGAKVPTRVPTTQIENTPTPAPTDTPSPTLSPTPATPIAEAVRSMPLRGGPSSSYPVVGSLNADDQIPIIGISEDGNWYQVTLPDGSTGWVTAAQALVTTYGDVRGVPVALAPTDTPTATSTPSPTPTDTPTSTPTDTPTNTPPSTNTPTARPTLPQGASTPIPQPPPVLPDNIGTGDFQAMIGDLGITPDNGSLDGQDQNTTIDLTGDDNQIRWQSYDGSYHDFVIRTTIEWGPGAEEDYCGFRFRGVDNDNFYTIAIDRLSGLGFQALLNNEWQDLISGNGSSILTGINDLNQLVLVALGNNFIVYINGHKSGIFTDTALAEGEVSLLGGTLESSDKTNCTFTNSDLWSIAHPIGGPQPLSIGPSVPIHYSETQQGTIDNNAPAVNYSFDGHSSDVVSIFMNRNSDDLDALVILIGPDGNVLAAGDDVEGANTRDASIEGFQLPADGQYTIVATRFQQNIGLTKGQFTLRLEKSN